MASYRFNLILHKNNLFVHIQRGCFVLIFLLFYVSFALSYLLFHPSAALSRLLGAIDLPNDRKIHSKPTVRGGGFSLFVAFTLLLITLPMNVEIKISLSLSGALLFLIGFLDDVVNISPFIKLSGQFLALAIYHLSAEALGFSISIMQGILSAIWIVFITNATNLIDGLDGLAGGVCASEALCLAALAMLLGNDKIFVCSFLLLGAVLGFLPRNFPNAQIFMGDCGALFLGFTLAVLSSRLVIESGSFICLLSVLLIFRVPIYDTNVSIVRRILKRKNPFKADKEHFHHLLLKHGFTKECAALALISISLVFGLIGIILSAL